MYHYAGDSRTADDGFCGLYIPVLQEHHRDGVRQTLRAIANYINQNGNGGKIDMQCHEVPSGTEVFDWTVPKEWKIRAAYIEDESGKRIVDMAENNLHVMGYSVPVDEWVTLGGLKEYVFTQPDVIPYVTSYYKERYSLFTRLLCGNANIVRLPSKDFPQVGLINGAIRKVLAKERHASLRPYIHLVRYGRDKKVNDYFSSISDVRVVWGGDRTIAELRQSPMPPRATELLFADRYSLAVIDSDAYMASENKSRIVAGFYNDTYLSDQNACTSPRAVIWTGGRIQEAKGSFWAGLEGLAESKYPFQAIQGVDKLSLFCAAATRDSGLKAVAGGRNILWRIRAVALAYGLQGKLRVLLQV